MIYLQYFLSILTLVSLWLMGNKSKWGPIVGVIGQIFWVWYVINTEQWGLLPGVIAYTVVNVRNYLKWKKEEK